jgi:hypothetical protein
MTPGGNGYVGQHRALPALPALRHDAAGRRR